MQEPTGAVEPVLSIDLRREADVGDYVRESLYIFFAIAYILSLSLFKPLTLHCFLSTSFIFYRFGPRRELLQVKFEEKEKEDGMAASNWGRQRATLARKIYLGVAKQAFGSSRQLFTMESMVVGFLDSWEEDCETVRC